MHVILDKSNNNNIGYHRYAGETIEVHTSPFMSPTRFTDDGCHTVANTDGDQPSVHGQ